jgi:hypothetical protein
VACDQVEQDPDAAPPGFGDERRHVLVGSVPRRDHEVVRDVVPCVAERRSEARVEPDRIDPEPFQVIQVRDRALQVADSVAVAVGERGHEDLVDHTVPQPSGPRHVGIPLHRCWPARLRKIQNF